MPELTQAPDSFVAEVVTSEGAFEITMIRAWSPLAVDRAHFLMANDYYAGARFYRVEPGFCRAMGLLRRSSPRFDLGTPMGWPMSRLWRATRGGRSPSLAVARRLGPSKCS